MTRTQREKLRAQLVLHEGLRLRPYLDSVGKMTIGVGRNLDDRGITRDEAMTLLEHDIREAIEDLETFPSFAALDPIRQRVLVDMRFNLGPSRFRGFKRTLAAVAAGDYVTAASQMRASLWYRQVKARGVRLANMMETGLEAPELMGEP